MLRGEWEVKRVVVDEAARGRRLGRVLMAELERYALAHGARRLILQCGKQQPEAVALSTGLGYTAIPKFPPYESTDSLCLARELQAA